MTESFVRTLTFYHATVASNVESIVQYGLRPLDPKLYSALPQNRATLTTSLKEAQDRAQAKWPTSWAVVNYELSENEIAEFLYPKISLGPNAPDWYALRAPLPRRLIVCIFTYEAARPPPSAR